MLIQSRLAKIWKLIFFAVYSKFQAVGLYTGLYVEHSIFSWADYIWICCSRWNFINSETVFPNQRWYSHIIIIISIIITHMYNVYEIRTVSFCRLPSRMLLLSGTFSTPKQKVFCSLHLRAEISYKNLMRTTTFNIGWLLNYVMFIRLLEEWSSLDGAGESASVRVLTSVRSTNLNTHAGWQAERSTSGSL